MLCPNFLVRPSKSQVWERMQNKGLNTKEKLTQQRIALQQRGGSKPKAIGPTSAKVSSWFKSRLGGVKPGPVTLPLGMFKAGAADGEQGQAEPAVDESSDAKAELQEGADDWMAMAMMQAQRRQNADWRQLAVDNDKLAPSPPPLPADTTMPKALKLLGLDRASRSAPGAPLPTVPADDQPVV